MENKPLHNKHQDWTPLWINLIILATYGTVFGILLAKAGRVGVQQNYVMLLVMVMILQSAVNLLLLVLRLAKNKTGISAYIASLIAVLVIGTILYFVLFFCTNV